MTAEGCRQWREQLGAFALGRLDEAEHAAVQAHIEGCAACRAELNELTSVAELLTRADPERLEQAPRPPAELRRRVLARVREERRGRRRRRARFGLAFAGAAAAIVLMVVVATSLLSGGSGEESGSVQRVSFDTGASELDVTAALEPRTWGTEIHMYVHGAKKGALCTVWLRRSDGGREAAGSFRYRYDDPGDAAVLTSALAEKRVQAVGLEVGKRTYVAPVPHGEKT